MLTSASFVGRNDFAKFLNGNSLVGDAVEVGTHRGDYTLYFLSNWHGRRLYCIDPWVSGYSDRDPVSCRSNSERLEDYKRALEVLIPFGGRVKIIRDLSVRASGRFKDGTLDFVYIDANHEAESFKKDLEVWWPKVRSGGVLAGHDFVNKTWGKDIQDTVIPFANLCQRDLYMVREEDGSPWSFYLRK